MSMTPDEIAAGKAKLAKLLNMTVENGCSEDEQETAMRMAAGLAARIGISLDSVKPAGNEEVKRKAVKKTVSQEFKIHQVFAAQAAAELYGCELYLYNQGRDGLFFIGREENANLAEQTMFWLMRQVELLYKQSLPRGMTQSARAEFRKTFKAACAQRVYHRALDLMREMQMNEQAAQAATGQNALVVQGYFKQLREENAAYFGPTDAEKERAEQRRLAEEARRAALTPYEREKEDLERKRAAEKALKAAMKRKGPRQRRMPVGNGTNAGYAAGDRVKLRTELS